MKSISAFVVVFLSLALKAGPGRSGAGEVLVLGDRRTKSKRARVGDSEGGEVEGGLM